MQKSVPVKDKSSRIRDISITLSQVEFLAKTIAPQLHGGETLALIGPLGSGKTMFTKALAKELKIKNTVTSPTFVIMNRYETKLKGKKTFFYHLDLYRTESFKEITALGITEIWNKPDTITVLEWADKIQKKLPPNTTTIHFRHA